MDASQYLARVIGLYLLIVSIAIWINVHQFMALVFNLLINMPLMFSLGFFTLIVGILLVVKHNIWQRNWRVVITILGWITFLKGASIVLYPQFIDRISMIFAKNEWFAYLAGGIDFVLGVICIYFGFRRNKVC